MPVDDVLMDAELAMDACVQHLAGELKTVRTGRATPAIVENVKVEYYGSLTDIKSIAAISVPEATQIVIKPFVKSDIKAIERAISDSKTGLTAHSDGTQLRINLPPMSMDRRRQMAGQCKEMGEKAKVQIRNARRDAMKVLETEEKGGVIREDDLKTGKTQVDDLTKRIEGKLEELVAKKTGELMDV
jgi:ribosome recycling factor